MCVWICRFVQEGIQTLDSSSIKRDDKYHSVTGETLARGSRDMSLTPCPKGMKTYEFCLNPQVITEKDPHLRPLLHTLPLPVAQW